MLRLVKYAKPYIWLVLLSIVLLFVMANADLALPDYLSQIVNVGIQQSGVDTPIPQALRQSQKDDIALFLTAEEQEQVKNAYRLVEVPSDEYQALLEKNPNLTDEPFYVLNDLSDADTERLSPIMSRGMVTLFSLNQMIENPDQVEGMMGDLPFDPAKIPAGMDISMLLQMLPPDQLAQLNQQISQRFETMTDTLVGQLSAAAVKSEYEALGMDLTQIQTSFILRTGATMIGLALLSGIASVSVSFLAARTSAGVARDVRRDVFAKVESFSSQEFNQFSTASLITRATNDVTQVQSVSFMIIRMAFFAPILGIGGVIRALDKSPNMWWIIALAVAILLFVIVIVFLIAMPKFKIYQRLIDRLNLVTRENLSGIMVIRAFNKQSFEEGRFNTANRDLADVSLFVNRIMVLLFPIMSLIMNGLSVLIIWVGANQIAQSTMQVGDMIAFLQYSMQIMSAFLMLSMLFIFLPRAFVSGDRIANVLETENIITDPPDPKSFPAEVKGKVEFKDVHFRYPDAEDDVLEGISFTANPGEMTAIIGSTGCGKSTVVNLIPRLYDVTQGSLLVDGVDVRELTQHDLREVIGYTPQHGVLFSGTVASNLRLGNQDASDDNLRESLEIAQADDFVFANPEGLETSISQGGTNVSGGQKQRLNIARSLVKRPPIFIFDDSFSALDFKTDAALRKALKEKTGDSTVLLVTQRVATVKGADQIIVLENGKIVGKGTHPELMKTCQTYQEIATSQLSKEELA